MFKKLFLTSFLTTIMLGGLLIGLTLPAYGQDIIPSGGTVHCPDGYTGNNCGDYELNDFIVLAVNISQWVLGIVGSLSLLMFVYSGFTFLISAGSAEKISQAKKIIVAAVIGLIIVFASWLIIRFVMQSLGIEWNGSILPPPV